MKFQGIMKITEMQLPIYSKPILQNKMETIALGLNSGYCKEQVSHTNNFIWAANN